VFCLVVEVVEVGVVVEVDIFAILTSLLLQLLQHFQLHLSTLPKLPPRPQPSNTSKKYFQIDILFCKKSKFYDLFCLLYCFHNKIIITLYQS
jgi:hypothetical protein